jgi:glutamate/tyrosine decarboxylase-like PLP-dependent enzyme
MSAAPSISSEPELQAWTQFFDRASAMMSGEVQDLVRTQASPTELREQLELGLPSSPRPLPEVVDAMFELVEDTPSTASPRFFNQLFGGRTAAASMGEMLSVLLNNSMYTFKAAGVHALIERTLSQRMCALSGFTEGEGSFTPGGSLSNLLAVILARGEQFEDSREHGFGAARPILYTSKLGHYSIPKNAGMAGIGRSNVRYVATDTRGRMLPDDLERQINEDRALGHTPFFINATAGTTVLGAFDPLVELSRIATAAGIWLHVDGALGGSMLLSERTRPLLDGLERADSFTWDAHKMMGVPLTCSVLLVRQPGILGRQLSEKADYLFHGDDMHDRGQTSMQCGRRNDALKLWAAWQALGDSGLSNRIDDAVASARHAAQRIEQTPGLTLAKQPESVNVVFQREGVDSKVLCAALQKQGLAVVGSATVDGETVVRLSCVNSNIESGDIDSFVEAAATVVISNPVA